MRPTLQRALRSAACLCMLLPLAACAAPTHFSLETIGESETGAFVCPAVAFGATAQEAGQALDADLKPYMETDGVTALQTEGGALGDRATPLYLEFQDGALYSVYTTWRAGEADDAPTEADFDALYSRAVERFGAPTTSKVNEPLVAPDGTDYGVAVTEHIWVRETPESITQCHLVMDTQGGAVSLISLILNTRPPDAAG